MAGALISGVLLGMVALVVLFVLVGARREALLPRARLTLPLVFSFLVLVLVVASDWPGSPTNAFWSQHSVLAALAAGLPVLGIAYFVYESHVARTESELDRTVVDLGRSAVLDHLITLDVALGEPATDRAQAAVDLLALLREWLPLLSQSKSGRDDLIRLGALQQRLAAAEEADALQRECRILAWDVAERCGGLQRPGLIRP